MRVPLYKLFQFFVFLSVVLMVGYLKLLPVDIGFYYTALFVVLLTLLMFICVIMYQKQWIVEHGDFAKKYLVVYFVVIMLAAFFTKRNLNYSTYDLIKVIIPYLYIFLSITLIYIFSKEGIEKTCKVVSSIVNGMLIIKTICWALYNFLEITIFPNILFQYEGWIRDGFQRIDTGFLFFAALVWNSYQGFKCYKKKSLVYLVFYLFFTMFVARYRFLLMVTMITIFVVFYYSFNRENKKAFIRVTIFFAVLFCVLFGLHEKILEIFSSTGTYGSSTINRLSTLTHYFKLLLNQKAWFGLGLLDTTVRSAREYMLLGVGNTGTSYFYYIDDIGIFGGVVRFGLLSLALYIPLIGKAIKVFFMCRKRKHEYLPIYAGVCTYMVISCVILNFFDSQRAFDTPFYLAFISYIGGMVQIESKSH